MDNSNNSDYHTWDHDNIINLIYGGSLSYESKWHYKVSECKVMAIATTGRCTSSKVRGSNVTFRQSGFPDVLMQPS